MAISTGTPHVLVGQVCDNCGQCCGGTCAGKYKACRKSCYPCCTESVLWAANLDLPALYPVALDDENKIQAYNPTGVAPANYAVGLTMHPVVTDANGRMTNYRSVVSYIPACGEFMGVIWTSGEYPESQIADGDPTIIGALLSQPSFAKRLPNGYIRIL